MSSFDFSSFYNSSTPLSFRATVAVLLLARRFEFGAIYQEALRRLRLMFPSDMKTVRRITFDDPAQAGTSFNSPDCMLMVNVARKLALADILPTALYFCAQLPIEQLFGAVREGIRHPPCTFSLDDLELCTRFRSKLQELCVSACAPLISGEVSDSCTNRQLSVGKLDCARVIPRILRRAYDTDSMYGDSNPLRRAVSVLDGWCNASESPEPEILGGLCQDCYAKLEHEINEAEQDIWDDMFARFSSLPGVPVATN